MNSIFRLLSYLSHFHDQKGLDQIRSERVKQGFHAAEPVRPLTISNTRALNGLFTWLRLIQILEKFSAILTAAQAVFPVSLKGFSFAEAKEYDEGKP